MIYFSDFGGGGGAPIFIDGTKVELTSSGSSIPVAYLTGLAADDIAVLFVWAGAGGGSNTVTVAGFTEALQFTAIYASRQVAVFWKRLTGGETGDVTASLSASCNMRAAYLAIYRGCLNSGTPIETIGSASNSTDVNRFGVALREIADPDRTILHFSGTGGTGNTVLTQASDFTARAVIAMPVSSIDPLGAIVTEKRLTAPGYVSEEGPITGGTNDSFWSSYLSLIPQTAISSTTPVLTDPYIASVVGLSSHEGLDGALAALDAVRPQHTLTRFGSTGTAEIDTAQSKFGSAALRANARGFRGDTTSNRHQAFWLGAGAFTVEAWVRYNSLSATLEYMVAQYDSGANQRSWALLRDGATNTLRMFLSTAGTSGTVTASASWTPSTGVWYHVAADYDGTDYRTYVDGVMLGKTTASYTLHNSTVALTVGAGQTSGSQSGAFDGWIDEWRVTKGVARYASDSGYTVPTAAFPRD